MMRDRCDTMLTHHASRSTSLEIQTTYERTLHPNVTRRHPPHRRPVRQVQHLHQRVPGGARHRPVPGAEVRRSAGAAVPRSRLALARPLAGLLLGLRRLHAGVPARRQGDGDQHRGQGRAAHTAVSRESVQPEVVAQHGVRLQRGARPGGRLGRAPGQRGDGVPAGAHPDGEDGRHRPRCALPNLPLQEIPRLVLRPAPA